MVAPPPRRTWVAWAGWCVLVVVALWLRPPMPLDETRYLSVAWEMWQRGDFLVPHMNGLPYAHKPPLLFWLFHLGWAVFGVVEWWPRLVPPLLALAALGLTARLGRRLAGPAAGRLAPLLLLGCWYWAFYTTMTMFDLLVVVAVLLVAHGVLAVRDRRRGGAALVAAASCLGVLGKGPVLLLYSLPLLLLAPWWGGAALRRRLPALLAANLGGALLVLCWAVPAARAGGPEYADAILWGQSAGRVAASFAHARPFWWYLPLLPVLLLPWTLVPAAWGRRRRQEPAAPPLSPGARRFLIAWAVPPVVLLSLVSGKQPHYLLPVFPAIALLAAAGLAARGGEAPRRHLVGPGLLVALLGAGLTAVAAGAGADLLPAAGAELPAWPGMFLVLLGGGMAWLRRRTPEAVRAGALAGVAVLLVLHLGAGPALAAYDLRPAARLVAAARAEGRPVAWLGHYQDQLHFLARLEEPIAEVRDWQALEAWWRDHPGGVGLVTMRAGDPRLADALDAWPYMGRWLAALEGP